jgi:hypothetical protein
MRPRDGLEMTDVLIADAEHDERTDISENGLSDSVIELTDELICECQVQAIAAGKGQNLVEVGRLKEFELVNVDEERNPFRLRD